MGLFSRLFYKKPDPNRLLAHEIGLFEQITSQKHVSVPFAAVRLQLREWLAVTPLQAVAGVPGWVQRTRYREVVELKHQRHVGALFRLPKAYGRVTATWPLVPSGAVSIEVGEIVDRVILSCPLAERFELPDGVHVAPGRFEDESSYWTDRAATFPDLADLANATLSLLTQTGTSSGTVVLPAKGVINCEEIAGIRISDSYARLLHFANGMQLNNVSIWGCESDGVRIEKIGDRRWLLAGSTDAGFLLMPIADGKAKNEVYLFRASKGPPKECADSIMAVALSALNHAFAP